MTTKHAQLIIISDRGRMDYILPYSDLTELQTRVTLALFDRQRFDGETVKSWTVTLEIKL